ncbi:hypothetical protein ElyMa_002022200 [Elysia marginata]|uniref:Uncharacterized protein n=1 Tax=Elysia marginata TaxID=1093978 RepID=A0AAV4F558_9GAST|nr:hypothetical protein ElyMa_002022200 [Elysia marginata]
MQANRDDYELQPGRSDCSQPDTGESPSPIMEEHSSENLGLDVKSARRGTPDSHGSHVVGGNLACYRCLI